MLASRSLFELAAAALGGATAGLLGSYAQQYASGSWPTGVVLGVLLAASVAVFVRAAVRSRWAGTASAVGWFAVVTLAAAPRHEGDLLVPGDGRGWSFLLLGALVQALAVAVPVDNHRRAVAAR